MKMDDSQRIVGVWGLEAQVYEDVETNERVPIFGDHPKGRQIATSDGRWLALATAETRPVPKTDAERALSLQTMIAYTGRYRCENGVVTTKGRGGLERGLGRHRTGAQPAFRDGRPAPHRQQPHAAPEPAGPHGARRRDLAPRRIVTDTRQKSCTGRNKSGARLLSLQDTGETDMTMKFAAAALAAGFLLTLAAPAAEAQTRSRPLTIQKMPRSYLVPGNIVPLGSRSNYVQDQTVFNRTPDQVFGRDSFGNGTLPRSFGAPSTAAGWAH